MTYETLLGLTRAMLYAEQTAATMDLQDPRYFAYREAARRLDATHSRIIASLTADQFIALRNALRNHWKGGDA